MNVAYFPESEDFLSLKYNPEICHIVPAWILPPFLSVRGALNILSPLQQHSAASLKLLYLTLHKITHPILRHGHRSRENGRGGRTQKCT